MIRRKSNGTLLGLLLDEAEYGVRYVLLLHGYEIPPALPADLRYLAQPWLCGYVEVEPTHPWAEDSERAYELAEVPFGWTYEGDRFPLRDFIPDRPGATYWLGFDTNHYWPGRERMGARETLAHLRALARAAALARPALESRA